MEIADPLTRIEALLYRAPGVEALPTAEQCRATFAALKGKSLREKLASLEEMIGEAEQTELPVTHRFSRGVYARELFIPRGTILVGKIHKFSQINFVLRGDIMVLTEDGVKRCRAGDTVVSEGGIKRAGFAIEDTVWTTVHGTHETDLDVLEEELISPSFEDYDAFCGNVLLKG